jgi:hypothetical protein
MPVQVTEADPEATSAETREAGHRPSVSKHLERAIERLGRVAGRLEYPESFRDSVTGILERLTSLRESGRNARGVARDALVGHLAPLDQQLMTAARSAAPADVLPDLFRAAEEDLSAFRGRLSGEAWQHAVEVTVDRLLRDRFGLPTIELEQP